MRVTLIRLFLHSFFLWYLQLAVVEFSLQFQKYELNFMMDVSISRNVVHIDALF
jgi:hypothetical protein